MILGEKYGKRRSIQSEDLFLEIVMSFGEKLLSARSKPSFVFREFLPRAPNFKYPPLIGVTQNFIF